MSIPLPKRLTQIINEQSISNLYLLLTKYVGCWYNNRNNWEYEKENKEGTSGKTGWFKKAVEFSNDQRRTNFYNNFFLRWMSFLNSQNTTKLKAKVEWRLVVGLGSGSVLETSMTLHHIFGVPYIPGTALKGVVSSYYIEKNKDALIQAIDRKNENLEENKKYKKETSTDIEKFAMVEYEEYIKIFGNENQKGRVTFFDAYPTQFPKLEMDIMNPHFSDYYEGKTPPADYLTPTPIKFLTVAKDTEFIFAFKTEDENLKEIVKTLITEALQNLGIGAKTAVGYGYFKEIKDYNLEVINNPSSTIKQTQTTSTQQRHELPGYLKNENELKDEYLRPDGTLKSEEEYKKYLESKNQEYTKKKQQQYQKAKNWYEKNKKGIK